MMNQESLSRPSKPSAPSAKPDLDAYALLLAHMQRFPEGQAEILAHFRRTPEEWAELRACSQKALDEAAKRKDIPLLARFAKTATDARGRMGTKSLREALAIAGAITPAPAAVAPVPAMKADRRSSPSSAPSSAPPAPSRVEAASASWKPQAVPLLPPAEPGVTRLSVQQYASLRAEIIDAPLGEHGAIRARYGLDEVGDMAEAAAWAEKFVDSPELFDRYKSLFQYYRAIARRE